MLPPSTKDVFTPCLERLSGSNLWYVNSHEEILACFFIHQTVEEPNIVSLRLLKQAHARWACFFRFPFLLAQENH